MDAREGSILASSPTLPIISKSASIRSSTEFRTDIYSIRVLIATIRDKGLCPCPRCLVRKSEFDKLSQKLDAHYHITQARTYLGDIITSARNFIYKLGYGIGSAAVERLLKEQSWVPTRVCAYFNIKEVFYLSPVICPECICRDLGTTRSRSFLDVSGRSVA